MTLRARTSTGGATTIADDDVRAFVAGQHGSVLGAGDARYEEARRVWNGAIDRKPALIARCAGVGDVVRAVRFAGAHDLLVSVRGGGHGVAGLAVCDGGVVIDLAPMRRVDVDPAARTARAEGGCLLADVDRATTAHGLAAVLGMVSQTGIAGLTLGGGFGWLTRRRGWTCDTLASIEIVTAAGDVARASPVEDADLFWALRGGGGNFGVATAFTYRLFDIGPAIVGGLVAWRGEDARDVARFYRAFTRELPRDVMCVLAMRHAAKEPWLPAELHGRPIVAILACASGDVDDGERRLAPLRAHGAPVADLLSRRPYAQLQCMLDAGQPAGRRQTIKSHHLSALDDGLLDTLIAHTQSARCGVALLSHVDGALNELPADASPMGARDARYLLNISAAWDDAAFDDEARAWARDLWAATRSYGTGGVYVNFLADDDGPEKTAAAYSRAALSRLAATKRRVDPTDMFRSTKRATS